MNRPSLYLHQELLLTALHDEKGTLDWKAGHYVYAVGGALLAELFLAESIELSSHKKPLVGIAQRQSLGDEVLDDCLRQIAESKRRRQAADWVSKLAGTRHLRHRIARSLCQRGVLRADEDTILLIFNRKVYPTLDPAPERRIRERLQRAIFTDTTRLQPRTAILASLASASEMLPIYFEKKDLRKRKGRIRELSEGQFVAGATREAVQAAQAAAVAASMIATNAAVAGS